MDKFILTDEEDILKLRQTVEELELVLQEKSQVSCSYFWRKYSVIDL